MNKNLNLQNPTLLGSLIQVLIKLEENSSNHLNSNAKVEEKQKSKKNTQEQIVAELKQKNYVLETPFKTHISNKTVIGQNMSQVIMNLEGNRDHTIFYFLAQLPELNFLYKEPILKQIVNQENFNLIFKINGSEKIKETSFFNTNHAMNIALVKKNEEFIDFFAPTYLAYAPKALWSESVKVALNYGNQSFLNKLNEEQTLFIKNLKNASGRNATYYAQDFSTVDYLKNKFALEPKSLADWFEKNLYHYLDLAKNELSTPDNLAEQFLNLSQQAKERNVDIEHFVIKPQKKELKSPPVWFLLSQIPEVLPFVIEQLKPDTVDSAGSNFIYYLFNTFKKQAPDTKKSFDQLASLEKLIKAGHFDLERKNNFGLCALDILKETINKETRMPSIRLNNYKVFCEKIMLLSISSKLYKPLETELQAVPKSKKMKI